MKRVFASSVVFFFLLLTLIFSFQNCSSNSSTATAPAVAATATPTNPRQISYNSATGQQATQVATLGSPPVLIDTVGISPVAITAGQFNPNGSGGVDLLISGSAGVYYVPNNGAGIFNVSSLAPLSISGLGSAGALVTGQFGVATGIQGFAVVDNTNNNLIMIPGNGDGTFNTSASVTSSIASHARSIFPFDLNGDTYLDAQVLSPLASSLTSVVSTFNPVTSIVTYAPNISNLGSGAAMAVGDLNGDGLLDVVTYSGGNLNIFIANPSGFNAAITVPVPFVGGSSVMQIAIGDLNGDGQPDIVAYTNSYSPTPNTYAIDAHYFQNGGGGNFTYVRNDTFTVGPNMTYTGAVIQDLNGDGYNDMALVASFGIVGSSNSYILLKACSQTSTAFMLTCVDSLATVQNSAVATAMTIADVNADGLKDVIVTGSQDNGVGNNSIYVFLDNN